MDSFIFLVLDIERSYCMFYKKVKAKKVTYLYAYLLWKKTGKHIGKFQPIQIFDHVYTQIPNIFC